jgi:hypothetical protein
MRRKGKQPRNISVISFIPAIAEEVGKGDRKPAAKPKCKHCGKIGHSDDNCWSLEKNAKKRPATYRVANTIAKKQKVAATTSSASTAALFTEEQLSVMMKKVMSSMKEKYGNRKKPKRQVRFEDSNSSSDSDDKPNSDNVSPYSLNYTYFFDYHRNVEAPLHKRQKVEHYSAEIIVEIVDSKNNLVPIRALLDTGTSETILLKRFLSPNSPKGYKGAPVTWKTLGGNFTTHRRAKIQFAKLFRGLFT